MDRDERAIFERVVTSSVEGDGLPDLFRCPVPNGWLVIVGRRATAAAFVPDPEGAWLAPDHGEDDVPEEAILTANGHRDTKPAKPQRRSADEETGRLLAMAELAEACDEHGDAPSLIDMLEAGVDTYDGMTGPGPETELPPFGPLY